MTRTSKLGPDRPPMEASDAKVKLGQIDSKLASPDLTPEDAQKLQEAKRLLETKIKLTDNPQGGRMDRARKAEWEKTHGKRR